MEMKQPFFDNDIWIAAKILQGIYNTDIKYYKYKKYDIVYFKENKKENFIANLFSSIKRKIRNKHKINVVVSKDSSRYGFENTLPFYYNEVSELLNDKK